MAISNSSPTSCHNWGTSVVTAAGCSCARKAAAASRSRADKGSSTLKTSSGFNIMISPTFARKKAQPSTYLGSRDSGDAAGPTAAASVHLWGFCVHAEVDCKVTRYVSM